MAEPNTELEQQGGPHTRPNLPSEGTPHTAPSGAGIGAGHLPSPTAPESGLAAGVHPMDPTAAGPNEFPEALELPAQSRKTRKPPFSEPPGDAFGVFQRAATDWGQGTVIPNAATNGGVATVVGRQPGRVSVKLWVPNKLADGSTPLGVVIGPDENELQAPSPITMTVLNVGDSITLETEGSVYCAVIPGNQTGAVQYVTLNNPAGGPVGD